MEDPTQQFIIDLFPIDTESWGARVVNNDISPHNARMSVICTAVDSVATAARASAATARRGAVHTTLRRVR